MPQPPIELRPYRPGDEPDIVALFNEVFGPEFGQTRTLEQWRHDYLKNPLGPSIIWLAHDKKGLVGHYALAYREFALGAETLRAGLDIDTMVHRRARGRGLFIQLADAVYEQARRDGYDLVYGVPNENSKHGNFTKLQWRALPPLPIQAHPLRLRRLFGSILGPVVGVPWKPLSLLARRHYAAEAAIRETDLGDELPLRAPDIQCRRVQPFLKWRFADVGDRHYLRLGYYEGDRLAGYMVGRVIEFRGRRGGAVVDFWPPDGDAVLLRALFANLARRLKALDCDVLFSVLPPAYVERLGRGRLLTVPERLMPKTNYFGYRLFTANEAWERALAEPARWAVTLADWDNA